MRPWQHWAVWTVVWLGLGAVASAQSPGRYQPTQPTISPWMGLYSRNTGALDNYHTFVRPEQDLRSTLTQQNHRVQQNTDTLQGLRTQVRELEQPPMRATGTASVFMDYLHYYDGRNAPGGQLRPSAGSRTGTARARPAQGR